MCQQFKLSNVKKVYHSISANLTLIGYILHEERLMVS